MILFLFIFGLCIGSFLNVLVYRLPRGISLGGRSFCPYCQKKIAWYDNIPLLSFLLLNGKCRFCRKKISFRYPIIELTTGLFYSFIGLQEIFTRDPINGIAGLIIISCFIAIFIIDWWHQIIPDILVFISLFTILLSHTITFGLSSTTLGYLLSGIGAGIFFLAIFLLTKGKGMGFGDVKLAFLLGLILGYPKIIGTLYGAFLTGALCGIILVLMKKRSLKTPIAFGPFLVANFFLFYFFGDKIVNWFSLYIPTLIRL